MFLMRVSMVIVDFIGGLIGCVRRNSCSLVLKLVRIVLSRFDVWVSVVVCRVWNGLMWMFDWMLCWIG